MAVHRISWLRSRVGRSIRDAAGQWWRPTEVASLLATVEEEASLEVHMGKTIGLPCRLLVQRVPAAIAAARRERLRVRAERKGHAVSPVSLALADWSMLLTSLPASRLSVAEGMALYRARWQIELLFKLWKQGGLIDEWHSLCEWNQAGNLNARVGVDPGALWALTRPAAPTTSSLCLPCQTVVRIAAGYAG